MLMRAGTLSQEVAAHYTRIWDEQAPSRGRRIFFAMQYGMARAWRLWKEGTYPGHHLFGAIELARRGYEVILPEPLDGSRLLRRIATDRIVISLAGRVLRSDDIIYCGHNKLCLTMVARAAGLIRARVVAYLHGRDVLPFARSYDGVLSMTPAGTLQAKRLCPDIPRREIPWGVDLGFYQPLGYRPRWAFSCGKTMRDFAVLHEAFASLPYACQVIGPRESTDPRSSSNVTLVTGQAHDHNVSYADLQEFYYGQAAVALITLPDLTGARNPYGITSVLEAMALARPVIVTRTGAVAEAIDVEALGVGRFVPVGDARALAEAVRFMFENPFEADAMGRRGRELCDRIYNMDRMADDLHEFFQTL
jgi:glycosyltransferase involved in cell wall biosynthesis